MRQKAELLTATAAGDDFRNDDFVVGEAEVEVALLARAAEEAAVMSAAQANAVARRGARRRTRAQRLRRRVARGAAAVARQRDGAARRRSRCSASPTCLYPIGRSGERVGRITTVACWLVVAGGAWLVGLAARGLRARAHRPRLARALSLLLLGPAARARRLRSEPARRGVRRLGRAALAAAPGSRSGAFSSCRRSTSLIPRVADATRRSRAATAGRRIHTRAPRGRGGRAALVLVDSLTQPTTELRT